MKKLFICLLVFSYAARSYGQDYFLKNFSEPLDVTDRSAIAAVNDDGVIHATHLLSNEIVVRRINKCGDQIWAKEIKHASLLIDLVDIKPDRNGNFIFAGNLYDNSTIRQPFLMSLKFDGTVNYFRKINLPPNVQSITYSFLTNHLGEFYLYFNYDIAGTNPGSISVAKLDNQGSFVWLKSYPGTFNWGRAFTTQDGGLLFRAGSTLVKIDNDGNIDWANNYAQLGYIDYPIEVDGGYILFKYPSGQVNNTTNLIKLSTNGDVLWVSNDFYNFSPKRGILRSNGNVLFTGNALGGIGLLELDSANGSVIRFKQYDPSNTSALTGVDLYENQQGDILVSGIDNSFFMSSNLYLRVDSTLNLPTCSTNDLQISSTRTPNVTILPTTVSVQNRSNTFLSTSNEPFQEQALPNGTFIPQCIFQEDRGNYKLGNDTILCPKESLTLGDANSTYDKYLWSTGAQTKQIDVSQAGTYMLSVITACDTLRDTIVVSIYPDVNLSLGNDTSYCKGDSILLESNLSLSNYLWSTGETTKSIYAKQNGLYWLETIANCGVVRDTIFVTEAKRSNQLELGPDTTLCPGDSIILGDPSSDFPFFIWQNGETSQFITVRQAGMYHVEAFSQCDTMRDTVTINLGRVLNPDFTLSRETVRTTEPFQLNNTTTGAINVTWNFSDGTQKEGQSITHQFKLPGLYTIRMTVYSSEGCAFMLSKTIEVIPSEYSIPTVFSPNNDGVNDAFLPVGPDIEHYEIKVYSRWGRAALSQKDIPWDGRTKNGRSAGEGVYYYTISLYFNYGGVEELEGTVTLLR